MTRTERYFDLVKSYRKELRRIWNEYEQTVEKLERYKGSVGYDEELNNAASSRDNSLAGLQAEYLTRFGNICEAMKESALNVGMIAPSQEQLAILSALKMREKLTRDELEQAGRSLRSCPVALAVVDELSVKHGLHGVHSYGGESTSAILAHVEELTENGRRLCALTRCESKQEMVERASPFSPNYDPSAMRSFRVDCDPEDEARAMSVFGSVTDLEGFQAAVNN